MPSNILDAGSDVKSALDIDVNDTRPYRVGRCIVRTVQLEDIGLVG